MREAMLAIFGNRLGAHAGRRIVGRLQGGYLLRIVAAQGGYLPITLRTDVVLNRIARGFKEALAIRAIYGFHEASSG
jgi:hypothetical protein